MANLLNRRRSAKHWRKWSKIKPKCLENQNYRKTWRAYHCPSQWDPWPEIRWLSEICTDVENEPQLQPLNGEVILPRTANRQEDARADLRAREFWGRRQSAYFDERVFHPNAPTDIATPASRPCTGSKSKQRNGNMVTELGKLRMPLSHLWYFLLLEG